MRAPQFLPMEELATRRALPRNGADTQQNLDGPCSAPSSDCTRSAMPSFKPTRGAETPRPKFLGTFGLEPRPGRPGLEPIPVRHEAELSEDGLKGSRNAAAIQWVAPEARARNRVGDRKPPVGQGLARYVHSHHWVGFSDSGLPS